MTATPWGFRDILPEEAQAREEIAYTVKGCFREHHYLPVETPLLEDKGSLEEGGRIADTPFKLFDDDGRLLVSTQESVSAVTPGQSAVFYEGRRLVGGAIIASQRGLGAILEKVRE